MGLEERLLNNELIRTRELVARPDWYFEFGRLEKARKLGIGAVQAALRGDFARSVTRSKEVVKDMTEKVFEQLLEEGAVYLGRPDDDVESWNEQRLPVQKLVIHHTSRPPGLCKARLNAMHLLNLYVPRYRDVKIEPLRTREGEPQPLYSGHFDENGRMVFYGYHWLARNDHTFERLLPDSALAWHAGDWEVNRESVAICIDDDVECKWPEDGALEAVKEIIQQNYPYIASEPDMIVGHSEVAHSPTNCPGKEFK